MVNGGKLDGGELADFLIDDMEVVGVVSSAHFPLESGELSQDPAVEAGELRVGHGMSGGIEIVKVGELIAQRVADDPVGLADLVDALFTHYNVVAIILGSHPEAHHI